MELYQLLDPYVILKPNKIRGPSLESQPKQQSKEPVAKCAAGSSLSMRELKELMGCNRQIHKRVNGKVKRK